MSKERKMSGRLVSVGVVISFARTDEIPTKATKEITTPTDTSFPNIFLFLLMVFLLSLAKFSKLFWPFMARS